MVSFFIFLISSCQLRIFLEIAALCLFKRERPVSANWRGGEEGRDGGGGGGAYIQSISPREREKKKFRLRLSPNISSIWSFPDFGGGGGDKGLDRASHEIVKLHPNCFFCAHFTRPLKKSLILSKQRQKLIPFAKWKLPWRKKEREIDREREKQEH